MVDVSAEKDPYIVKPVAKALCLLDAIGSTRKPITLAEACVLSGLPKSTAFKYIRTLLRAGYLGHDPVADTYHVGPQVERLAEAIDHALVLRRVSAPIMSQLRDRFNETVNLAVLDGCDVVYLDMVHSTHRMRLHAVPGGHYPAYATGLGKVLLAHLPGDSWRSHLPPTLVALTPETVVDLGEFDSILRRIRAVGFAVDRGESDEYVWCVAAPILDKKGIPVAALSVSGLKQRVESQLSEISDAVVTAANLVASHATGVESAEHG